MRKNVMSAGHRTVRDKKLKFSGNDAEILKFMQRRFNVLLQESHDVFEVINPDGSIQYISPSIERVLGYTPEERIGKKAYELLDNEEKRKFIQMMDLVLAHPDQHAHAELSIRTKGGKEISLEVDMRNELSEPSIQGIIINWRKKISPYTELKEHLPTIFIDGLTKLPNRAAFDSQLAHEIALASEKGQTLGLMILDIDRFKYFNGYLGYELGDQLLCQINQRLKSVLEEGDYLFRYSGDQFAFIFCQGNQRKDYEEKAKEILRLFESPFLVGDYKLAVSVRMGISIYPQDSLDMDSLTQFANIALLRSKVVGSKRYEFFSPLIGNKNHRRFLLYNDLHKALEGNQFKVYYQPIVDLYTHKVVAVEALLRWEHPQCGMVSPAEFIPIMEETGFIVKMGKWLLEKVCQTYKRWQLKGYSAIKVSVNFSPIQFAEDFFVENIKTILDYYQFTPHSLIIEITENMLLDNDPKIVACIQRLQEMGIKIAVDDFGTGFSSLAYLSEFNIDILKIDSSFVQKIPSNKPSTIITRSIIDLARELNIMLVAEGIETQEQLSYLQMFNCRTGQGYLFSKPVPQLELEKILADRLCPTDL